MKRRNPHYKRLSVEISDRREVPESRADDGFFRQENARPVSNPATILLQFESGEIVKPEGAGSFFVLVP